MLNDRKSTAATPSSSEPRELIDRKFVAVYEENSGAWEMAISLSEHFQKLLHQSHSAEDDEDDDKTSVSQRCVSSLVPRYQPSRMLTFMTPTI